MTEDEAITALREIAYKDPMVYATLINYLKYKDRLSFLGLLVNLIQIQSEKIAKQEKLLVDAINKFGRLD